jgi:GNAT superfamily N-acetyltransferase
MITLVHVESDEQRELASVLISEYLQWIDKSAQLEYGLTFDIEAMLASDIQEREKFQPPFGRFYLAQEGNQVAGVGCLKRLQANVGEIQRMYVRSEFRGKGIGRLIAERLIANARSIGYERLRLESLKFLESAHALYHSLGFKDIAPYTDNSMKNYQDTRTIDMYQTKVVFMELVLQPEFSND